MQRLKSKKLILLAFGICTPLTLTTPKVNASSFGAEIFCTMRDGGNDHESSWDAAYTYIKKQKGGFFKVSPKNAAAQITETVIREREKFSYCVEYLDNLHPNRKLIRDLLGSRGLGDVYKRQVTVKGMQIPNTNNISFLLFNLCIRLLSSI